MDGQLDISPSPVTVPEVITLKAPPELRACKPQPPVPASKATDRDIALFIQGTVEAGADCRDKVARRNSIEDAAP